MKKKPIQMPQFKSESQEADWWASTAGRTYLKQKLAQANKASKALGAKSTLKGSKLVTALNEKRSVQIALRLPEPDLTEARKIAERKGIGYQTLLKMLVHEGLARESRRA